MNPEETLPGGQNYLPVNRIKTKTIGLGLDAATIEAIKGDALKDRDPFVKGKGKGVDWKALGSMGKEAGLSALTELPSILATAQINPGDSETKAEVGQAIQGKAMSYASTGMKIGSAFGPIGTAAGAILGYGAGYIGAKGAYDEFDKRENDREVAEWAQEEQELQDQYYKNTDSKRMEATLRLLKEQEGLV